MRGQLWLLPEETPTVRAENTREGLASRLTANNSIQCY